MGDSSDSSDFTFCQVGLQVDDHQLESPKTLPNIQNITLQDNRSEFQNIRNVDDANRSDSSCDNIASKDVGSSDSSSDYFKDTQPPNFNLNKPVTRKAMEKTGDSVNGPQEQKPVMKKPVARAKVPFEKGYSQMDWLKLTRTHPDLAGLKGQTNRRLISMDEVKQHKEEGSIWTVLKGRVYNISPYMKFHPGGVDMLMKAAGKDCTTLFNKYHAWVNAEFLLEKCLVGVLDAS